MSSNITLTISYPLLLDGGLSNVLEEQDCDLNHKLWTASLLEKNPEAIIKAHMEYIKAGAQCITTASYQASIPGLVEIGYDPKTAQSLILKSIQLADIAIQKALDAGYIEVKPLIAASIGPYGAYLADGSEYRGNYGVSKETLLEFHLERAKILDSSNADIFAIETIPSLQEAKVISEVLKQVEKPAWVSFSCKDGTHLNDGTPLQNVVSVFRNHPHVFALGVNCTNPSYISELVKTIKANAGTKKVIVYPNSGEAYNAKSKTWLGVSDPNLFVQMAQEWIELGADIIGGCCRIGPDHIRRMKEIILN